MPPHRFLPASRGVTSRAKWRAILLSMISLLLLASSAVADREQWVRHHQGGPARATEEASTIVVHPSGEITVAGVDCEDVLVLRLDAQGHELWSWIEEGDGYAFPYANRLIADGEEAMLSVTFHEPYVWVDGRMFRFDRMGALLWDRWTPPVTDLMSDGQGGAITGGSSYNSLCGCPAFITRMDRDGNGVWGDRFPDVEPAMGTVFSLAGDPKGGAFALAQIDSLDGSWRRSLRRYSHDGGLAWELQLASGRTWLPWPSLARHAPGGSAVMGSGSSPEPWVARFSPAGKEIWRNTWPDSLASGALVLAVDGNNVTYTAAAIPGALSGTNIHLVAYDSLGFQVWETTYDTGGASIDLTTEIVVDPEGDLLVLGQSDGSILLLRYSSSGALIWDSRFGDGAANGRAIAPDASGGVVVSGSIIQDMNQDLLVVRFDSQGLAIPLATRDSQVDVDVARALLVQVTPEGDVIAAIENRYACASALEFLGYSPAGELRWIRTLSGSGSIALDPSGASTFSRKEGPRIELARWNAGGVEQWTAEIPAPADHLLDGLSVSAEGKIALLDQVATSGNETLVIGLDPLGMEEWRRVLDHRGWHTFWGADDRLYAWRSETPTTMVLAFDDQGETAWSSVLDLGRHTMVAAGADVAGHVFLTGNADRGARYHWITLRVKPGGKLDWLVEQDAGNWNHRPTTIEVHPDGGVAIAGTVDNAPSHALLLRYSDEGTILWQAGFGVGTPEDLAVDRIGNVILVFLGSGTRTIKYGPEGQVVWDRAYVADGTSFYPRGRVVSVGPDLSVAVAGGPTDEGAAFILKYTDALAVEISALTAERHDQDVLIRWSVAQDAESEADGFRLLSGRETNGDFTPLMPGWLEAEARSYWHRQAPAGSLYYLLEMRLRDGAIVQHGPVLAGASAPAQVTMGPPIPNPAPGLASWQLDLPRPARVRLTICDLNGRIVASAVDGPLAAGSHRLTWDGKLSGGGSAARGVYFFRLEAEGKLAEGKLVWTRGQ